MTDVEIVERIEALVESGEHARARAALDAARGRGLEGARLDALDAEIERRGRLLGAALAYEEARTAGDDVAARRHALTAAADATEDAREGWRQAAEAARRNVISSWRIGQARPGEDEEARPPDLLEALDLGLSTAVVVGDERALLVSSRASFLFLREIDTASSRLLRLAWLRPPDAFDRLAGAELRGDRLLVAGTGGLVFELELETLDVEKTWALDALLLPERELGRCFPAGPGHFWAEVGGPFDDDVWAVIDLERFSVVARPPVHHVEPVLARRPPEFLTMRFRSGEEAELTVVYDAKGEPLAPQPALEDFEQVGALTAHPRGRGYLALVAAPEPLDAPEEDGPELYEPRVGIVELSGPKELDPPDPPIVLPDTSIDTELSVGLDSEARHVFVSAPHHAWDEGAVFAFRATGQGLREVWSCELRSSFELVASGDGRGAFLLTHRDGRLDVERLGKAAPESRPSAELQPPSPERTTGLSAVLGRPMHLELSEARGKDEPTHGWLEKKRRSLRADPEGLAELGRVAASSIGIAEAEALLAWSLALHPEAPALRELSAELLAERGAWREAVEILDQLSETRAGLAKRTLAEGMLWLGDREGARAQLESAPPADGRIAQTPLEAVVEALDSDTGDPAPAAEPQLGLRGVIRACRAHDARRAAGDLAGARAALDVPAVWGWREEQSAARLAAAELEREPASPLAAGRRLLALARFADAPRFRLSAPAEIPGLGWEAAELAQLRERVLDELDGWGQTDGERLPAAAELMPALAEAEAAPEPEEAPKRATPLVEPHRLSLLPHERAAQSRFGVGEAIGAALKRLRLRPEVDDTTTFGSEILDLDPLAVCLGRYDDAPGARDLARHLEYGVSFGLHHRKLFHVGESLAFMLGQTTLDVEASALRLPFPAFGVVFEDSASLRLAEEALGLSEPPEIWASYVIEQSASEGRRHLKVFTSACTRAELPPVEVDHLVFELSRGVDRGLRSAPEARRPLLERVLNAVLYATSAGVDWPIAPSAAKKKSKKDGRKKKKRRAGAAILVGSAEDVFFLPGKIPISALPPAEPATGGSEGPVYQTRFMVRGHWRRAAAHWKDPRPRWIEPHWKGPEMAAAVEKAYRLKI